jgi:hypothetical protein
VEEHHAKVIQHFQVTEILKSWFFNEAELEEIGVTATSSIRDLLDFVVKSEKLLQRYIYMTVHTRLLYNLGENVPILRISDRRRLRFRPILVGF